MTQIFLCQPEAILVCRRCSEIRACQKSYVASLDVRNIAGTHALSHENIPSLPHLNSSAENRYGCPSGWPTWEAVNDDNIHDNRTTFYLTRPRTARDNSAALSCYLAEISSGMSKFLCFGIFHSLQCLWRLPSRSLLIERQSAPAHFSVRGDAP